MEERNRKRLIGAAVLAVVAVVFLPMLLDDSGEAGTPIVGTVIPPRPADLFEARIVPIDESAFDDPVVGPSATGTMVEFPPPLLPAPAGSVAGGAPPPVASGPTPAGSGAADGAGRGAGPEPAGPLVKAPPAAVPMTPSKPPEPGAGSAAVSPATPEPTTEKASVSADAARAGVSAWAVQLGSFGNAANAASLRDALRGRGYPAFLETVETAQGRKVRVYVGPEILRAKALEAQSRLEREMQVKGIVVRYPG